MYTTTQEAKEREQKNLEATIKMVKLVKHELRKCRICERVKKYWRER